MPPKNLLKKNRIVIEASLVLHNNNDNNNNKNRMQMIMAPQLRRIQMVRKSIMGYRGKRKTDQQLKSTNNPTSSRLPLNTKNVAQALGGRLHIDETAIDALFKNGSKSDRIWAAIVKGQNRIMESMYERFMTPKDLKKDKLATLNSQSCDSMCCLLTYQYSYYTILSFDDGGPNPITLRTIFEKCIDGGLVNMKSASESLSDVFLK
eukprot:NP_508067.1 Uncharacterized protein CELE_Y73B3A.7 [Caenorhabditis elegans]